jgi:hypothetical protein
MKETSIGGTFTLDATTTLIATKMKKTAPNIMPIRTSADNTFVKTLSNPNSLKNSQSTYKLSIFPAEKKKTIKIPAMIYLANLLSVTVTPVQI